MYRRILVPVDGSPLSTRALAHAIELARLTHGALHVIHVIEEPFAVPMLDVAISANVALFDQVHAGARRIVDTAVSSAVQAGVPVERLLVDDFHGRVDECLLDAARQWPADLIVMGTHGRRGVARALLGSDAERILRTAPCPVLLVREAD